MPIPSEPEHTAEIDLGVAGTSADDAAVTRRRGPSIGNAVLALAAVVMLLSAGVVAVAKLVEEPRTEAEHFVWAFLEAARDGDGRKALSMTDHYAGIPLIDGDAVDRRWEIVEVAQVASEKDRRAEVYVEIEAHDGVRIGDRLTVDYTKDEPKLFNALKRVEWHMAFTRPVVNDVEIEVHDGANMQSYYLLPGSYVFTEQAPPSVAMVPIEAVVLGDTMVVAGEDVSRSYIATNDASLTASGREAFSDAVREYLDDCVVRFNAEGSGGPCPIGHARETRQRIAQVRGLDGDVDVFDGAVWAVTAYPDATVSALYWGMPEVPLMTIEPGSARVDLADGSALECPIWMDGTAARFLYDGAVQVSWGSYGMTHESPGCATFTEAR